MYNLNMTKMKSKTHWMLFFAFLSTGAFYAQDNSNETRRTRQGKITKKVSVVDKKVNTTNTEIDSTIASVDGTINGAKNTVKKIGALKESIFGPKKEKGTSKTKVVIEIIAMDFDDQRLEELLKYISKAKGIKKVTKEFGAEQIKVTVTSKKVASELWDTLPKDLQNKFKMISMKSDSMMIKAKTNSGTKVTE